MSAIILSAVWGVVMMFCGVFFKSGSTVRSTAVAGLLILLISNLAELYGYRLISFDSNKMLVVTSFGLIFNSIIFGSTLLYLLLSGKDIEALSDNASDHLALIFFVLCGAGIVSSYNTLLMLFIGIEIISIPLYILTGSDKKNLKSNEASLKYFLMGSFSTGLMLMGIALIYGARGTFSIDNMGTPLTPGFMPLLIAGLLMLVISMSFKVSAAPFHFWTPDVYDGAPTVFTSFMATIVKVAAFVAFLHLFEGAYGQMPGKWTLLIAIITASTLFIGNITAVFQQSVKRMLAYSSIAQAGFMFFALFGYSQMSREGLLLYSAAYCLATIGIFAILIRMKDYTFEGFNGLGKHEPLLAAVNTIFLLSLAGIPLTAGFTAKFYMLASAVKTGTYLWLVLFAVICAAISVYYYFRVIQAMYFKDGAKQVITVSNGFKFGLIVIAAAIILLGVYPQVLFDKLYF